jgi:hypothetical protein
MCGYVILEESIVLGVNQIVDLRQHLVVHAGMSGPGNPQHL